MKNIPPSHVVEEKMSDILSRPEFLETDAILKKFIEIINDYLSKLKLNTGFDLSLPVFLIMISVILLIVSVIIFIIVKVAVHIVNKHHNYGRAVQANKITTETLSEGLALVKAKEAESRGEYREAVRYMFFFLLFRLSSNGFIKLVGSRTNYQYIKEMAVNGYQNMPLVYKVVHQYDETIYGGRVMIKKEYDTWCSMVNLLMGGDNH